MVTLSAANAYAADPATLPPTAEDNPKGTLDQLVGQDIPNTDPVQKYPASAYTLTKVQEGGDRPAGDNIITKFTYNAETKVMTPVYYRLNLKDSITNIGSGDSAKYYALTKESDGGLIIEEVEQATDADITVKYDKPASSTDFIYAEGDQYKESGIIADCVDKVFTRENAYFIQTAEGAEIGDIKSNVIGSSYSPTGSLISSYLIYNKGSINSIQGSFINNVGAPRATEGASSIANDVGSYIGSINADFIDNHYYSAGAILNNGEIGSVNGNFIYNSSVGDGGGAIVNTGTINSISGSFIGNFSSSSYSLNGGAINNTGTINNISADFIGNYITTYRNNKGGAVYNGSDGVIGSIVGDFIGNRIDSIYTRGYPQGGAIANDGTINSITGDFIRNSSGYRGGAIYNTGSIDSITGDFIENSAEDLGAAIYNTGSIENISGTFIGNSGLSVVQNYTGGNIKNITGSFINNDTVAISNSASLTNIKGLFVGNDVAISAGG